MIFDYARHVWQFQFDQQAEQSPASVASTLTQYAGSSLWLPKCMDGTDWQATFDTSPAAIDQLSTWQTYQQQATVAGITAIPWVVATGKADAVAHALLGNRLVVDLEPYQGFWSGPTSDIPAYIAALRAGGVTELYVSIDPRPSAMTALDVAAWAGSCDGLLPQNYWTDEGTPAMSQIPYVQACLALNPHVWPVFPYDGAATDLGAIWAACVALGCTGCGLFRLGSANLAQLQTFGALPLPAQPTPAPVKPQMTDTDRLKLCGYVAGGSSPTDIANWVAQFSD